MTGRYRHRCGPTVGGTRTAPPTFLFEERDLRGLGLDGGTDPGRVVECDVLGGVATGVEIHRDDAALDDVMAAAMVGDHRVDLAAHTHDCVRVVLGGRTRGEPCCECREGHERTFRRS